MPPAPPHPEESCGSWTETQPEPGRAVWFSSPLPSRQACRLPDPRDFRKRRPDLLGKRLLSQRLHRQEASFSLCKKHLAPSSLSLCILLAILYPVWEFQKHLQLSFVQPHICRLKGSVGHVTTCNTRDTEKPGHQWQDCTCPLLQRPGTSQKHGEGYLDGRNGWHFTSLLITQTAPAQHPRHTPLGFVWQGQEKLERVSLGYIQDPVTSRLPLPFFLNGPVSPSDFTQTC